MGYNVEIVKSTVFIPKEVQPNVLHAWKYINQPAFDNLKSGGAWTNRGKTKAWYSWMESNYDETCKSCEDILDALGFYYDVDDNGDILINGYDSKTGDESLFFVAVANLLPDGVIEWVGEDHERWNWEFKNGVMYTNNKPTYSQFLKIYTPSLLTT